MLELKNISHSYISQTDGGKQDVFEDFSLTIHEGELVSLVGQSGIGKTTLVNIIAGYLPPVSGSVLVNGRETHGPAMDRIVINQVHDLFDWMTVRQNMELVCDSQERIDQYLLMTGLNHADNLYPYELSGGMKKRASLARALSADSQFIIMDEPFSSLDYQLREKLQESLRGSVLKSKKTVLFVTHDIEEAIFLSERICILSGKPTNIKKEIAIPFGKIRESSLRDTEEFSRLKKIVREEIEA